MESGMNLPKANGAVRRDSESPRTARLCGSTEDGATSDRIALSGRGREQARASPEWVRLGVVEHPETHLDLRRQSRTSFRRTADANRRCRASKVRKYGNRSSNAQAT